MVLNLVLSVLLVFAGVSVGGKIDPNLVRYGSISSFDESKGDRIGTIKSQKLYLALPEYQTIKSEKVKPGTARYTQLMRGATMRYSKILSSVSKSQNFVIIVEEGGVHGYKTTDITTMCIERVKP